jgi:ribosomal protein S18 acetylase RimI-like enzyme
MHVRPARESDIPQMLALKNSSDVSPFKKYLKEMSRNEGVLMVAEDNGAIIGQVFLAWYGRPTYPQYPDIRELRVSESRRGEGIGSELIQICEHLAIDRGYNTIGLAVNPTLNAAARRLYQRLGYLPTGEAPYLDGVSDGVEDWVIDMVKKLPVQYT